MMSLESLKAAQKTAHILISLGVQEYCECFVSCSVWDGPVQMLWDNILLKKEMLHIEKIWPYV